MTQLIINTGSGPDASDGDSLYVAFTKINENFSNIWVQGPVDSNIVIQDNNIVSTDVNGNIVLLPNGIGYVQLNNNTIPGANNAYFLGDKTRRWRGMYVGSAGIETTGNLTAGNLIIAGSSTYQGDVTFDGNVGVLKDFSTVGNITGDSNLTISGSLTSGPATFGGNVAITGNLQVAGNIVYINVEELRVNDPIIELGTGPNGAPLTTNDGYSRGILMDYYSDVANTQQYGFMGLAGPDHNTFQFVTNATDVGNVFTGTPANLSFGNAYATGELSSTGNVIGGNITTAGNVSALGNIDGANLNTGGNVSAEGTIVGNTLYANSAIQSGNSISAAGNITGAYILGNGAFLTGIDTTLISNGASLVKVVETDGNIIANVNGNTIGLWTTEGYTVTGNISASGYYVGNGRYLTGVVADSIGNVIASLSVSGNINTGNLNSAGNISGNYIFGNGAFLTGIDTSKISNGTSNVHVATANGNVDISVNGTANVVSVADNGLYVTGIVSSTGNASVGAILTDNYYYANGQPLDMQQPAGSNTWVQYNDNNDFGASSAFTFDSSANALAVGGNINAGNLRTTGLVSASGNIIGGNLRTTGAIVGNTGAFLSDVAIYGNLQVGGNIVYIDVTELRVQDPVIEMGGGPNGTPLTTNDGFSRGLKLDYFSTDANAAQFGFIGLAASDYTTYQFLTNAVDTDNTFSGTAANLYFGNAEATGNIAANGILTDNYYYANGQPLDMQQPAGSNTWIQFNSNNDFGASANLTFNSDTNTLSVGGNIVGANILTNGIVSAQGNGAFGNISTTGNVDANIINVQTANIGSISVGNVSLTGNISAEAINANLYISANGNVIGSNLLTSGQISASGNIITDTEVTATGNVTGGNINTDGIVSAVGNIVTSGIVTATGNVIGNNIVTNGEVTATGNVTGSNLITNGLATVTGNVIGGNLLTDGLISSTGNLTSGNIDTAGLITAEGNITGANIITSGVVTATGNGTFGNISTTGNAEVGAILTDNYYYANGQPLDMQQPAGSNTWVQFNSNNDFGASANLTFNSSNNELYIGGIISASGNITGANITGSNLLTAGLVSATGSITSAANVAGVTFLGNVEGDYASLTSNVNAGNLLTAGIVSAAGNLTAGNIETPGHLGAGSADFTGDVNIVGNLNVDGNVTYIDVKDLRVEDPVITLGGGPNGSPLVTSDGFSRGLKLEYFNSTANTNQFGFLGLAASDYTTYQFLTNATDIGNTFTGTAANIYFGNAEVTGLVTVIGNVDAGNLNTSGLINATGNLTSGNIISLGNANISGNAEVGGILTDNYYYANGAPVDFEQPAGSNTWVQYNDNNDFGASSAFTFDSVENLLTVTGDISATANVSAGNLVTAGNAEVGAILTDNYYYANGAPVDFQQPAGSNTWVQYNDNNDFGASANLTFENTSGQLYVSGNVVAGNFKTAGFISATGNIDGGNLSGEFIIGTLSTNAQPNITSIGTLTSLSVTGNVNTSNNIIANGNALFNGLISSTGSITSNSYISATGNISGNIINSNAVNTGEFSASGNAYVGGDLTINGNVTYINITELNIEDPIIGLGRGPNNSPLTVNDGKDRGEQLWYFDTAGNVEQSAFIGYDNSTSNLIAAIDVTNNNEIITVNNWGNFVVGNLVTVSNLNSANVLFVDSTTNTVSIGTSVQTSGALLALNSTDSLLVPIGNTLQRPTGIPGMVRYNTTLDTFEFYTQANGWTAGGGSVTSAITSQTFTADGITEVFSLTHSSTTNDSIISINGVVQTPVAAYSIVGTTLTFTEPPDAGDTIEVRGIVTGTTVRAITNSSGNASVSVDDAAAQVNVVGNIIPDANVTYNLGSPTNQWKDLYLSGNTIYIGGNSLSVDNGNLSFNGNISGQYIYGNGAFLTGISGGGGNATLAGNLSGNLEGNGFGANAFTFVSATGNITSGNLRTSGSISAAGNLTSGNISTGIISASGNVTAQNFIGNISITGNVTGTSPNVQLVAGAYTSTFDNTGNVSLANGTVSLTTLSAAGNITGANIIAGGNIVTQGGGVINKASGFVNAGTFVTLDNIKATVTTSGNRGLSLATVSGTAAVYVGANYALISGSPSGSAASFSLSTTATSSLFGWNFANQGDTSTYILNDTTNNRAYRITLQIGGSYLNNFISIERL